MGLCKSVALYLGINFREDIDIATIKKETLDLGESMLFPFKVELMLPTPLERLSQASMEFYGITALCLP